MKIYFASDHAGYDLKTKLKSFVVGLGYEVEDCGPHEYNADDDYPDFVVPCARLVANTIESLGVIIGGSGQGEAMVANRMLGIRCALFYGKREAENTIDALENKSIDSFDILRLTRQHNNANMLSLASRFLTDDEAIQAVRVFIETPFSNEERHTRRIEKF